MKTIKVYVLPSHQTKDRTSGVDFARILQPVKYLHGYEYEGVTFEVTVYDIHAKDQPNWVEIAKEYDVIYLNYTVMDWNYAAMGACFHGEGKKIIMDIDDAIWYLRKDNITYEKMKEINGEYLITCMLNDVDYITTTNRYLRNIILNKTSQSHNKIRVLPNSIDLSLYNSIAPVHDDVVTILHYGSTSHFQDILDKEFLEGLKRIFETYPQVKFKTVGAFISQLKYTFGPRYDNDFGDVDIYKWIKDKFPQFMEEADIIVTPLEDDTYNRSKSDIKFIEIASAGKAGIFSHVRPYEDTIIHGDTGYLAKTADDWYNSLKELIDSKDKREKIGKNAYEYVKKERQIQDLVKEYAQLIKEAVDKDK